MIVVCLFLEAITSFPLKSVGGEPPGINLKEPQSIFVHQYEKSLVH